MRGINDPVVRRALKDNFQVLPRSWSGLGRKMPGLLAGAAAAASPSLLAFTGRPGDNHGALPLASLINHWRQPQ